MSVKKVCGNWTKRAFIRVGAKVGPDDILVGKITPKGETELSAEENFCARSSEKSQRSERYFTESTARRMG